MLLALYQYGTKFGPENNIKLGYKSALLTKENDVTYRHRMCGNKLETREFYNLEDFRAGSSATRTNFKLEFIYE